MRGPRSVPPASSLATEIIGRGFDARIALNQLENIQEIGAHVMQLRLGAFAGSDAVERALDQA